MPGLRQNFFTKEWVVIATERAQRPDQLIAHREPRPQVSLSPNCPFCPRNENLTPPEVLRLPKPRRLVEGARHPKQVRRARA